MVKKEFLLIYGNILEFSYTLKQNGKKSVLMMCKSSKLAGSTFWKLFEVFILYTVILFVCTGLVVGASLYTFVEFGQKRTVPINRVFLYASIVWPNVKWIESTVCKMWAHDRRCRHMEHVVLQVR